ncbi:hypothetical protein FEM08_18470 [Flavobacterium gilvum]|nr:hypothetical protein FEM08_18470 [Flavobacterium gilvum]
MSAFLFEISTYGMDRSTKKTPYLGQNPYKELLNGLDKKHTIILDLFGESNADLG